MEIRKLESFAKEVARLAAKIEVPPELLPTYGHSEDFARPHIEFDGIEFHYVVVERGKELERITTPDAREILYYTFEQITSTMAADFEARHRIANDDSRRQLFAVQLELMGKLSDTWSDRLASHLDHILRRHPYREDNGSKIPSSRASSPE